MQKIGKKIRLPMPTPKNGFQILNLHPEKHIFKKKKLFYVLFLCTIITSALQPPPPPPPCYDTGNAATTRLAHSSIETEMKFKNPSSENHENPFALSFKANFMTIHA